MWEQPTKAAAGRFLDDGIRQAESSGIRVLHTFARTLTIDRSGILNWYDHPISTGPLEGTNNKIKNPQTPSRRLPRSGILPTQHRSAPPLTLRTRRITSTTCGAHRTSKNQF
ncbi:MAG: transposase [Planctomycetaceae bacterium]